MLYALVSEHLESFLEHVREHHERGLPPYVENEFREYLQRGIHAFGFLRARGKDCGEQLLVPFSCNKRGACPCCNARRMQTTAAHLTDGVLPDVTLRPWVLSVPCELDACLEGSLGVGDLTELPGTSQGSGELEDSVQLPTPPRSARRGGRSQGRAPQGPTLRPGVECLRRRSGPRNLRYLPGRSPAERGSNLLCSRSSHTLQYRCAADLTAGGAGCDTLELPVGHAFRRACRHPARSGFRHEAHRFRVHRFAERVHRLGAVAQAGPRYRPIYGLRGSVVAASGIVAGSTIQLLVVACQPRTAEPAAPLPARATQLSVASAVPRPIASDSPPPPSISAAQANCCAWLDTPGGRANRRARRDGPGASSGSG